MSETNTQDKAPEQPQYTEEQMKQMRSEMTKFYSEEIKFLKKQEEYERLLADIEEHKTRKLTMMQRAAQMFAQSAQAKAEAEAQEEAYRAYAEGVENGTIDEETGFPIIDGKIQYPEDGNTPREVEPPHEEAPKKRQLKTES